MNFKALTAGAALVLTVASPAMAERQTTATNYSAGWREIVAVHNINNNSSDGAACAAARELDQYQQENAWVGQQTKNIGWNNWWHARQAEVNRNLGACAGNTNTNTNTNTGGNALQGVIEGLGGSGGGTMTPFADTNSNIPASVSHRIQLCQMGIGDVASCNRLRAQWGF